MGADANLILALNKAGPRLAIDDKRAEEIAVEIAQFRDAAETARKRTEFNVDVYDYRQALLELAGRGR